MKRKAVLALLAILLLSGCGNIKEKEGTQNKNGAVASLEPVQTNADQNIKESIEALKENPLNKISKMYADSQIKSEIEGGVNKKSFKNISKEYSGYILELGSYIELHQIDFIDGKSFADFADWENSFEEFYRWANNILYYNGDVKKDYQVVWKKFCEEIKKHVTVLDECYTQEGEEAIETIKSLLEEISNSTDEISKLMPVPIIKLGKTVKTKSYEFTLNKVELSYDIVPETNKMLYHHYVADSGQVYIHVDADVKNTAKQNLSCDEIYSVTADYNDGYTYNGFSIVKDTDGDFTYANITDIKPLQTLGVHNLINCPEEIETSGKNLFIVINLKDDSQYKYIIR